VKLETRKTREISGITAADVKFFRKTAKRLLFDHKRNKDVLEGLETASVCYESTAATVSGCSMLVEWIDQVRHRVLQNTDWQEKVKQDDQLKRRGNCYVEAGTGDEARVLEKIMEISYTDFWAHLSLHWLNNYRSELSFVWK